MKAGLLFAGCGPILILTTYKSFSESDFIQKLAAKGIKKFIVYEVPMELVKKKYGQHFDVIIDDLIQRFDFRVLDYNGFTVFDNFSFADLGSPYYYEQSSVWKGSKVWSGNMLASPSKRKQHLI